ncbi:hypothetical protein ILYODFUR_037963 [Ilyodon furcidens]|uniref:Uncharacterized protein n=1 Tax=Ilyodon furcidens TaxID=33524 RepID=A0ABV0TRF0_9TELE
MASLNSSQALVFPSATAWATARLASRYPSAASGVPQANHSRLGSFISFTASLTAGVHHRIRGLPPQQAPQILRPQLRAPALTIDAENMVHSDSMSPTSPGIWSKLGGTPALPYQATSRASIVWSF